MSGLGKNAGGKAQNEESLDELKVEFEESKNKIRKLVDGRKDKKDIPSEEKSKLSTEYLRASMLAKKIASRTTDNAEAEKYKDYSKKLGDTAASYGSSVKSKIPDTTFDDVKGLDDVKKIVESFVFMAENPQIMKHYRLEGGLGMMMYGAPGTGKTMFAEALANKLQLPLFIVTPADIYKSYVGASEQAVRQIFEEIDACPDGAILFVDECESIFSRRTQDTKDYKSAVTTELLQRLNGFGVDGSKRILVGATNRPQDIDPAYLRYKRFSHRVHVTPPDLEAKRAILEGKLKGIELDGITVEEILQRTECTREIELPVGRVTVKDAYYSAADICGLVEEACRLALERLQEMKSTLPIPLTKDFFDKAFEKIKPSISAQLLKEYENFCTPTKI